MTSPDLPRDDLPRDDLPSEGLPSHDLPSVDVVIATHQRPELLRRAIAGVMAQTYQGPIRLLVVHDKSTPDTSLEEQHPGRSVEVLRNTRTPGLAGARNSGIVAGAGDLVAFCDDDDEWRPDKLVRQVRQLAIDDAPTSVTGILLDYQDRRVVRVPRAEDLTVATLARHRVMAAHPSTVVVRRAALDQIRLVDEEIPGSYGEDYDWILRAAGVGGFAVVPEPLVLVRWGGSQFNKQWSTIIAAIDHLLEKHPAFRADHRALGRLLGQRAFALAACGSPDAWQAARTALRTSPRERRGYVAAAVALHLVSAERVLDLAHKRGRGI